MASTHQLADHGRYLFKFISTRVMILNLFLSVTLGSNGSYTYEGFPNPTKASGFFGCGVNEFSYVCDPGRTLTDDLMVKMNARIAGFADDKTCLCDEKKDCEDADDKDLDHAIYIAIVPRIQYPTGEYPQTPDETHSALRQFAEQLKDVEWRNPSSPCRMLIYSVVETHSKLVWTVANEDSTKVLTKEQFHSADREAEASWRNSTMYDAIANQLCQYYRDCLWKYELSKNAVLAKTRLPMWLVVIMVVVIVVMALLVVALLFYRSRIFTQRREVWHPSQN